MSSTDQKAAAQTQYQSGKEAFERGRYRQSVQYLEKAVSLAERTSRLGGEAQIWLVTAYQANGQLKEAIALCQQLTRHPDYETAKQGKRLLYILEAPRLQTRPDWLTQIPDLSQLTDGEAQLPNLAGRTVTKKARSPRKTAAPAPEPIDWSQVNTRDNRFVWVALVGILLILGSLVWLS
ncbi:MAG: tetratricopeptide repeat protein [Elainellaceae cyanobacterium]